jgi:hypothetical protein
MRIQITAGGIYGSEGELQIGTELTVESVPEGWAGRYIDLDGRGETVAGAGDRDTHGDTPAMAEMRARFDASYKRQGEELTDAKEKIEDLMADLTAKDAEIAALKVGTTAGGNPLDHDGDGKSGGARPNDPPSERDELKKQAAELGLEYAKNITTEKLKELIDAKLAA